MKSTIAAVVLALSAFATPQMGADEPTADPRTEVATAIPEAIRLLEAKEYKKMLVTFLHPDDLARTTKDKTLDEFAATFEERFAARLLTGLKSISDKTPVMSEDGNVATFEAKVGKDTRPMRWAKVGKFWYIQEK